jgi:hypothetical protein
LALHILRLRSHFIYLRQSSHNLNEQEPGKNLLAFGFGGFIWSEQDQETDTHSASDAACVLLDTIRRWVAIEMVEY